MVADRPQSPTRKAAAGSRSTAPKRIGRYRIERTLGSGGMGTVYLAEDTKLGRTVALKVMVKTASTPPNLIHRFLAEARTAAKLRHPNIVTVYDSGEADGFLYLALEYIDGPDIERVLRKQGAIPPQRSLEIIQQITQAVDHAHSAGVVHRDIKPSNILLRRDGSATLTDMGLARAVGETSASNITRAGFTVGTVDYMAPEQARSSRAADARSDLYSLGCTWFHMLTGRVPYPAGDLTNKLRAHATGPPPDPREVVPSVPTGIVAVIQRLMAQRPEDRYSTSHELLKDLNGPNLCRESVSPDDLRMLAEEFESPPPAGAIDLHENSAEAEIPAGSTMIESFEAEARAEEARAAKHAEKSRARSGERQRRAKARPSPAAASRQEAPRRYSAFPTEELLGNRDPRDWAGVAILFVIFVALLGGAIWIFANVDAWVGGQALPRPQHVPTAPENLGAR